MIERVSPSTTTRKGFIKEMAPRVGVPERGIVGSGEISREPIGSGASDPPSTTCCLAEHGAHVQRQFRVHSHLNEGDGLFGRDRCPDTAS